MDKQDNMVLRTVSLPKELGRALKTVASVWSSARAS